MSELPTNLDEAIAYLKQHMDKESIEYFKNLDDGNRTHFTLGMQIRNSFGLWQPKTQIHHEGCCKQSEDGKAYLKHYGQFTEVPNYLDFRDELAPYFQLEAETHVVVNGLCGFTFRKRKIEPTCQVEVKV